MVQCLDMFCKFGGPNLKKLKVPIVNTMHQTQSLQSSEAVDQINESKNGELTEDDLEFPWDH
jgi:hypothetical protein